ncbi:MAG: hypothetical protein FJZ87_17900, partial [Chloroflexi bacterium]|nr:hypothetical protein [Chloroflexota bacterium]
MPDLLTWLDGRMESALQITQDILPRLSASFSSAHIDTPDDLTIADNGLVFAGDRQELDHLWFEVFEREGGQVYHEFRVVRLLHLVAIPFNVRSEQGALAKMRTVLRGLYNAHVDLAYLVAGIYHPKRLGIVQCYGAVGRAPSLNLAVEQARHGSTSLEAALTAAYPQARLAPLDAEVAEWVNTSLLEMPYGVLAVGHPDPRENARSQASDLTPMLSGGKHNQQEMTLQQNELVMRGMAQIEEDFLLQVILTPVDMQDASRMLAGLAEYTSSWAAWQAGNRSFNLGTALPLMLSGAIARNAGTGFTQSETEGQADGG